MGTVAAGEHLLGAELNHGAPGFYRVSAKACETLMDQRKELELS